MIYIAFIILAILGVGLGAVLNALADDLPNYVRPSLPHCHKCGLPYHSSQWVALVAWVQGRSRCAQCQARMHWRRPVVEIASAIMLIFLYQRFGLTPKFFLLSLFLECMLLITVIDLEHRLILYTTIVPAALAALLYGLFANGGELWPALVRSLIGGAVGYGVFYLFYLLGFVYSAWVARRRGQPLDEIAFGGGDVNLAGVIGLAVGWPAIVLSLVYTVMAGGVISGLFLAFMFLRRRNALLTPLPYGPFIVLGAVIVLVFASELRRLYGITP
jgi:leader peptidase (prepilin peptidase) / N-methyltransferase